MSRKIHTLCRKMVRYPRTTWGVAGLVATHPTPPPPREITLSTSWYVQYKEQASALSCDNCETPQRFLDSKYMVKVKNVVQDGHHIMTNDFMQAGPCVGRYFESLDRSCDITRIVCFFLEKFMQELYNQVVPASCPRVRHTDGGLKFTDSTRMKPRQHITTSPWESDCAVLESVLE